MHAGEIPHQQQSQRNGQHALEANAGDQAAKASTPISTSCGEGSMKATELASTVTNKMTSRIRSREAEPHAELAVPADGAARAMSRAVINRRSRS